MTLTLPTMIVHLLFFLFCSLLAPKVKCCKNHNVLPCFVSHRSRHSASGVRHTHRRSTASSPLLMGTKEHENETPSNRSPPPHNTAPFNNTSKRIHKNNRMLSKSKINGSGDQHDNARLIALKMKEAQLVEKLVFDAVKKMNRTLKQKVIPPSKLFPSVRQCNAALATFGDAGEFRRALKLFTQMKKSASLFSRMRRNKSPSSTSIIAAGGDKEGEDRNNNQRTIFHSIDLVHDPPKPTLVTYSTLMSRAVSLGKPRVALRLWNLMRNQPNFYATIVSIKRRHVRISKKQMMDPLELQKLEKEEDAIVPDVIFCNTLMNAYAKLGDHQTARSILNAMLGATGVTFPCHEGIPLTDPTVVTYNTLADACKQSGELGAALEVPELMTNHANLTGDKTLLPDARTYTILISTVARKKTNVKEAKNDPIDMKSGSGGEKDPDMAFALLNRMINEGITPNGVTYCALIDVCSRCRRVDLALNGLRIMLKQKSKASGKALFNEVGAWTAAINACGKLGRVDTAIRLFRTMQISGVKPNSVTCGCLSDCLLKATPIRMTETLEVLQYMKKEEFVPGEVMYTSLMGIALTLAEKENRSVITKDGLQVNLVDKFDLVSLDTEDRTTEAIVLYTELMRCLIHDRNDDMILKVFLLFQEMRNAGATPDVACYNLLLRACAFSGDVQKAQDVLRRMDADGIEPNRASWREALRAAKKAMRSDIAESIWDTAVTPEQKDVTPFMPKASDVELLLNVYVRELRDTNNHEVRSLLNSKIMRLYDGIISKSEELGLHHGSVSVEEMEENQDFMLAVLRSAVSYELHGPTDSERRHAKNIAVEIAALEIFQRKLPSRADRASKKALQLAQNWLNSYSYEGGWG